MDRSEEVDNNRRIGKVLRRFFIVAFIIGIIIVGTPFGIQYGIIEGLTAAGSKQVKVEDVDFNPFTGELVIKELQAKVDNEPELKVSLLTVEVDWLPLIDKNISIKSLLLKGASLEIEQTKDDQLIIGGITLPAHDDVENSEKEPPNEEKTASEWGFGLGKVQFLENVVDFKSADFSTDIKIDDLLLTQLFSWKPGQAGDFAVSTRINGAPVSGELKLSVFADKPLFEGQLKIDRFALNDFIALAGSSINKIEGRVSTDLSFSLLVEETGLNYQQAGLITIQDSIVGLADIQLAHQKIAWDGNLDLKILDGGVDLFAKGKLDLDKHQSSLKSPEIETHLASAKWNGTAGFKKSADKAELSGRSLSSASTKLMPCGCKAELSGGPLTSASTKLMLCGCNSVLEVNGDLFAEGLNSQNRKTKLTLLQLDKLALNGISIDQPENIQVSETVLDGLVVAQKESDKRPLAQGKQIKLDKLRVQNLSGINLEKAKIDSLVTDISINKKGEFVLLDELIGSTKPDQKAQKGVVVASHAEENTDASALRVGKIDVVGKSALFLTNAAKSEMVLKKIDFSKITLGELNSQEPKKSTKFNVAGRINNHSKLSMKGEIRPFTQKLNANIDLRLKAVDLLDFSAITEKETGYEIESGQMNADVTASVKQDILDSNIKIAVHNLVMVPEDKEKIASISKQLTMPLDTALSMLRDGNNDIHMEIPVKGDVNDPDFSLRDVIQTALGNSVMNSAKTYMMYALQPYGLIYMAADAAYSAATAVVLDPVKFQPNDAGLTNEAEDYLEHIGTLMQKRPGIRIRVCGVATDSDRLKLVSKEKTAERKVSEKAQQDRLKNLAKKRADVVKNHLESAHEIDVERLFKCAPKVTKELKELPRVELLI